MKNVIVGLVACALFAAAAIIFVRRTVEPAAVARRPPTPPPVARPTRFAPVPGLGGSLAKLTRMPVPDVSPAALTALFPAFRHAPYDTAGFNPLALPFQYEDPDHAGDPAEANALAFLLSDALDWAPGNYSARHAYFVFDRGSDALRPLVANYDSDVIAREIQGWGTTHAVGGVLRRSAAGYAGRLEVFAADGSVAFAKDYGDPRPYFDLLGDMAVDAIGFFGPPPSAELAAFLHQPRCRHAASLARLGTAAFQPRDEAFATYGAILQDDPTFAEVRYWYANQASWAAGNVASRDRERQVGRSLHDRLTPMALVDFNPDRAADAALSAEHPIWVERATRLAGGPDAPLSVDLALSRSERVGNPTVAAVSRGVATAAANPNRGFLLNTAAENLETTTAADAELAASVATAEMGSRFQDPTGSWLAPRGTLARAAQLLARPDLALAVRPGPDEEPMGNLRLVNVVRCLCAAGRWREAVSAFAAAEPVAEDEDGTDAAHWAAVAAVTAGDAPALAKLRARWGHAFDQSGMSSLLDATGAVDLKALLDQFGKSGVGVQPRLLLAAELDVARGQGFFRRLVGQMLSLEPDAREFWPALDAYDRRDPSTFGTYFYFCLSNRYAAADPWAKATFADWRARGSPASPAFHDTLRTVRQSLAAYSPTDDPVADPSRRADARHVLAGWAGPFVVDGLIRALQKTHEPGERDLALRFRHLAINVADDDVASFAATLVRATDPKP